MLRYLELKTGFNGNGPAWVARVKLSKSGRTVYFNGMALKRSVGGGIEGNHYDLATSDEYWVSGPKKDGRDRHRAGSGTVMIEASAVEEYLAAAGITELDRSRFKVIPDLPVTDPKEFVDLENPPLGRARA